MFVLFLGGSTPGLMAGLLGVLGAPVSGPVSKSAPRGVAPSFAWPLMRRASLASPKRRFPKAKRPLPRHLRIR